MRIACISMQQYLNVPHGKSKKQVLLENEIAQDFQSSLKSKNYRTLTNQAYTDPYRFLRGDKNESVFLFNPSLKRLPHNLTSQSMNMNANCMLEAIQSVKKKPP